MVAFNLNFNTLSNVKSALRKALPAFGSAHISEALAAALGASAVTHLSANILVKLSGKAFHTWYCLMETLSGRGLPSLEGPPQRVWTMASLIH